MNVLLEKLDLTLAALKFRLKVEHLVLQGQLLVLRSRKIPLDLEVLGLEVGKCLGVLAGSLAAQRSTVDLLVVATN